MTAPQPAPETSRARRRFRRGAIGLCVFAAIAALGATGWPQTRLAETIAGRALDAAVTVEGLSLIPSVRMRSLAVAAESYAPVLLAEDVRLDYAVSLKRPLTALSVYRVSIHLDGSNPGASNYAFLLRESEQPRPKRQSPTRYVPRSIAVEQMDVEVRAPDAALKLEGLRLRANFKGSAIPSAALTGDSVSGYVQSGSESEQPFSGGSVDIAVDSGQPLHLEAHVSIPETVELAGSATLGSLLIANFISVKVETCRVNGDRVAGLLPLLTSEPVTFERVHVSDTAANLGFGNARVELVEATIHADATGLRVGRPGVEWYEGDIALTGTYADGQMEAEARLNRGQRLKAMAKGNIGSGKAAATLIGWSRDDFEAALPAMARPVLEQVPGLQQVEGTLETSWEWPRYTAALSIDPVFAPSAGQTNQLAVTGSGTGHFDAAAGPLLEGTAALRLGNAKYDITARVEQTQRGPDPPRMTAKGAIQVANSNPNRLLSAMGYPSLPAVETDAVQGKLLFDWNGERADLGVDLSAAPMRIGSIQVPAGKLLEMKGNLTADPKSGRIVSREFEAHLTENGTVVLRDIAITTKPLTVKAAVTGKLDFDYLAPDLGIAGLSGAVEFDAPLRYAGGAVSGDVTLKGDGLGYGGVGMPYGTPITVRGAIHYDTGQGKGSMDGLRIECGEGTTVTSDAVTLTSLSPVTAEAPIAVSSDLRPLVDLSLLDSADGTGAVSGTVGYGPEGARTTLDWDVSARTLVLADALAALGGVTAKGALQYGPGLQGNGKFLVLNAAAGGGLLTGIDGAFGLAGGVVTAEDVKATIYEGDAEISAQVDLFGPEGRGQVKAKVAGLNLDTFTKEYKPPVVLLTGLAQGDVELEWTKEGITDFRVDLSSDQDFSLNRESVEQLLLTALTSEVPGLKLLNRRIRKKTIGEDPMRRFDTATVSLRLEGQPGEKQRLMGPISLTSEMLDFSIDMGVDLGAIAEGLQLSQEAQLEDIEKISSDPLQWNE